ncbi:MAG: acyltransferase family protein [Clostridia bacterium]|nr:acyltransferase family protein [Clostridia bacterium]
MSVTQRNGKIDFYKFVFSLVIVLHHARVLVGDAATYFLGGAFAVEFFFLVSGYLFMQSIRKQTAPAVRLGDETAAFLKRKFKGFFPEVLVAWVTGLVLLAVMARKNIVLEAVDTVFEVALADMSGLHIGSVNGVVWYLSSMLMCMAVLYPMVRKWPGMMMQVVVPLSVLLVFGRLCGNGMGTHGPRDWLGWTFKGNLRAYGEIGLGMCLYDPVQKLRSLEFSRFGRVTISLAEHAIYIGILLFCFFCGQSRRDFVFLSVLAVAVALSFTGKGADARLFDNRVCTALGRFSFPLFLSHRFLPESLQHVLPQSMNSDLQILVYVVCSFITAFFVMGVSAYIRNNMPRWKQAAKKLFLA